MLLKNNNTNRFKYKNSNFKNYSFKRNLNSVNTNITNYNKSNYKFKSQKGIFSKNNNYVIKKFGFVANNSNIKNKNTKFKIKFVNKNFVKNKKYQKTNKQSLNLRITNKGFRVFDSIVIRRLKILKKVKKINYKTYNNLFLRYPTIKWVKDFKLVSGLSKYKKALESLESQGLRRKQENRRMSNYAVALFDKQKLKMFYLGLKEYKLKNIIKQAMLSKKDQLDVFAQLLESRLSVFIFRINFSKNFMNIFMLIRLGFVKINNKVIKNTNYILNPGDVVSFNLSSEKQIKFFNVFKKRMSLFYYPSYYIECSFELLSFIFYRKPKLEEIPYSFNLNLMRVLHFYNYKGLI